MTNAISVHNTEVSMIRLFSMILFAVIMADTVTKLLVKPVDTPEPYGALWLYPAGHIMNVSYGADEEPEYFGEAIPGTPDDQAGWRIYRYEYILVGGDLEAASLRFAEGETTFDKIWDDREDYEYR